MLGAENLAIEPHEASSFRAKMAGAVGATLIVKIVSEGEVSVLDFRFSYGKFLLGAAAVFVAVICLSLLLGSLLPLLGSLLILVLAYNVNFAVLKFLNVLNETLPYLEREYARRALTEDRKRWQERPEDTEELYTRLREKHVKTWGNVNVLEYKITEYQTQGLTRNEAIRRAAEEEGIH